MPDQIPLYKLTSCEDRLQRYQEMYRHQVRSSRIAWSSHAQTAQVLAEALAVLSHLRSAGFVDPGDFQWVDRVYGAGREAVLNVLGGEPYAGRMGYES